MAATIRGRGRTDEEFDMAKTTCTCNLCGDSFEASRAGIKFCGRPCAQAARLGLIGPVCCADCGRRMEIGRGSRTDGSGRCVACRRTEPEHGINRYARHGCRCEICTTANRDQTRRFNEKHRAKAGVSYASTWKRRFRDEQGRWPSDGGGWISRRRRRLIYERDAWTCHLCGVQVTRAYDPHDPFAPTLDHLTPRSMGGSDDESNLRTAHAICNARRGVGALREDAIAEEARTGR